MNKVACFGKTLSALAALLFAAVPVYAATFVKDVMPIGGNESETTAHSPLGLTVNGLDIAYASGTGWTFDGATVSLTNAGPFVLSTDGANFTSNVAVVAQADCAVTFTNLEVFAGNHAGLSPFTVAPGVSVALTLDGNTVLRAGSGAAAITVVSNATGVASLTIDAEASDTFHTLGANGGAGGMRRHAVLVDAEGNVTLDGWVTVSPLSSLTITGFALAPGGTATITFAGDGDLSTSTFAVDVSATPDFAALLAPASTNLAISGATGTFTVSPPASLPSTLFYRISAKQE